LERAFRFARAELPRSPLKPRAAGVIPRNLVFAKSDKIVPIGAWGWK
jgi:hypothetical protein